MKKSFEEKTISTNQIFKGNIISLQVDDVRLPNGKTSEREIVKHLVAVAIIPVTKDGNIIFVEQYRKPLERTLIEIPAGKIEPNEDKKNTALRELEEETGYTTSKLTYVTSFYTSPGFADEMIHLYYTEDVEPLEQEVEGDEDEFVELRMLSLEEAEQVMHEEESYDAKTMYALLYLKQLRLNASC